MRRRGLVAGGVALVVAGGVLLGVALTRTPTATAPLPVDETPVVQAALDDTVRSIDSRIASTKARIQQRANAVAAIPIVKGIVPTDEASANDALRSGNALTAEPGERVEIGQRIGRKRTTFFVEPTPPAAPDLSARDGKPASHVDVVDRTLWFGEVVEVVPNKMKDAAGVETEYTHDGERILGYAMISRAVELAPLVDALAKQHSGRLELAGGSIPFGTPVPPGTKTLDKALAALPHVRIVLAVPTTPVAKPVGAEPPIAMLGGGAGAAGLGLLALVAAFFVRRPPPVPAPQPAIPHTPSSSSSSIRPVRRSAAQRPLLVHQPTELDLDKTLDDPTNVEAVGFDETAVARPSAKQIVQRDKTPKPELVLPAMPTNLFDSMEGNVPAPSGTPFDATSTPDTGGSALRPGSIRPGNMVGRWEIVRQLGGGGMADVYLARTRGEGGFEKLAAIKVMHPHLARVERAVAHFLDEARLAAGIAHQNIVAILDLGKSGEDYYIVMEYIDGLDLEAALASARAAGRPVPVEIGFGILRRICDGLNAAHHATTKSGKPLDLIHRDVKCANVLISKNGAVKVVDFGIAKASRQLHMSLQGETKGTPSMMAPEQRLGEHVDVRVDVYAVGAVGYEILTNTAVNIDFMALAHLGTDNWPHLPLPTTVRPALPPEIDAILMRAMAFRREDRFPDCAEFELQIEAVMKKHHLVASDKDISRWIRTELDQPVGASSPALPRSRSTAD